MMEEGDAVIIQGNCDGLTLLVLNLSDCKIVQETEETDDNAAAG